MSEYRTTFVVGAGASKSFGDQMPVGYELAERIRDRMAEELDGSNVLGPLSTILAIMEREVGPDHRLAMQRIRVGLAAHDSIDRFIDEHSAIPKVEIVAKLAIAYEILKAEKETNLWRQFNDRGPRTADFMRGSWIGQIMRYANPGARRSVPAEALHGISFITFNYDRCIEVACRIWFEATCGLSYQQVDAAVQAVPIHHVYGSLGDVMLTPDGSPFGGLEHPYQAAARIRTFTESLAEDQLTSIRDTIRASNAVVFLGCAFHAQNVEMLLPEGPQPNQGYWATGYRMRGFDQQRANGMFANRLQILEMEADKFMDNQRDYFLR